MPACVTRSPAVGRVDRLPKLPSRSTSRPSASKRKSCVSLMAPGAAKPNVLAEKAAGSAM